MRYLRFETEDKQIKYGVMNDGKINVVQRSIYDTHRITDEQFILDKIKLLAPVQPSKVLCIGLNYRDHAEEFGSPIPEEPLFFLKPSTSVIGPKEEIQYPPQTKNLHYEAELAIVIGKKAKNISADQALDYVFGYTVANDVTARDLQRRDSQWSRAKGFDTFCPLGPWIETEVGDPDHLDIQLTLNGEVKQKSHTGKFVFKCADIIAYLSSLMTLLPGDVILTGTPAGIGAMQVGDLVEATIQNIGTLTNRVVRAY